MPNDWARIVAAWPSLSDDQKAQVLVIVEGRIGKRLKEMALLEQPFIKDSSINVEELVKQVAGKIGENIRVRRFTRYILGEGIEVQGPDFAEEVASMTSG